MRKTVLLIIFWIILIFSVLAQVSDRLIIWLNPDALSLWDERLFYTLIPVLLNFIVLFLLKKTTTKTFSFRLLFTVNALLFLYYFYYQYIWDVGEWQLF